MEDTNPSGSEPLNVNTAASAFLGFNNLGENVQQEVNYPFINPKAGVQYELNSKSSLYGTFSRANREPVRDDFTQSTPETRPKPEVLNDIELGWNWQNSVQRIQLAAYSMIYKNQLILTGKINDVGAYTRTNVAESYRAGVEVEYSRNFTSWLQWSATLALSQNKVREFTEYLDEYDANWNYLGQKENQYKNSDLAFSPNVVASSMLRFVLSRSVSIDWMSKYVGFQYLDNTQSAERRLDDFWVNDLRLNIASKKLTATKEIRASVLAANIFNTKYEPNGYSYGFILGGERLDFNYLFPQAGTNFLAQITFVF